MAHQDAGSDDDDDTDDEGSDAMSIDALEDQFLVLEEEVATLVADVHDLALYTKLNITGFMKILKVRVCIHCTAPRDMSAQLTGCHTTSLFSFSRNMTYVWGAYIEILYCSVNFQTTFTSRNKQTAHSSPHSFKSTWRSDHSISTTGTVS